MGAPLPHDIVPEFGLEYNPIGVASPQKSRIPPPARTGGTVHNGRLGPFRGPIFKKKGKTTIETTLIVGCGYLGRRVAALFAERASPLQATVRQESSARTLRARGLDAAVLDLDSDVLFVPPPNDYRVLYLTPPPDQGMSDPRLGRFLDFLIAHPPRRLVYAGSSAVYGDCKGALVDETHPVSPLAPAACRRLDAERAVLTFAERHAATPVVLRIAAIYGPGRLPIERLREGRPVIGPSEAGVHNRIHVDDLARICIAALEHAAPEPLYNVADGAPTSTSAFLRELAAAAGLPAPPEVSLSMALAGASPAQARYMQESRRLDVSRMRRDLVLGWTPAAFATTFARDLGLQGNDGR